MPHPMDAMIFAAGLGTRLRPLTDQIPKALVEIGGVPMLEHVARRLVRAGATRLIVNVHHHADQVRRFIAEREGFGVETLISDETELLLDTGGGLRNAGPLFHHDAPFLIHNVDVVTNLDLMGLHNAHCRDGALATLAVLDRDSRRYLAFDSQGLCGYGGPQGEQMAREPAGTVERLGFTGVHAVSPEIFNLIEEEGVFSIIPLYMRLVAAGWRIAPYRVDGSHWMDIGSHEKLAQAREMAGTDRE